MLPGHGLVTSGVSLGPQPAEQQYHIKQTDQSTLTLNHVKDVYMAFRVCVAL